MELKKCPFCGGEASMTDLEDGETVVLCDECNAFIQRTDEGAAITAWQTRVNGWVSVEDRLPKGDLHVLTFSDDERVRSMAYDPHYKYFSTYSDVWVLSHVGYEPSDTFKVTHWMPLPSPPEKGER